MPDHVVKFLHQYGPWFLLIQGVLGLLFSTLFFKQMIDFKKKIYKSDFVQRKMSEQEMARHFEFAFEKYRRLLEWSFESRVTQYLGIIQAVVLLIGSAVWFVLRP